MAIYDNYMISVVIKSKKKSRRRVFFSGRRDIFQPAGNLLFPVDNDFSHYTMHAESKCSSDFFQALEKLD